MTVTVSPLQVDLFTAVRAFIRTIVPAGTEVVQGIDNRVPMPKGDFVLMTLLTQPRLTTNQDSYPNTWITQEARASMQCDIQLDFWGADSQAWATMVETLWRDSVGCAALAPTCQPLYAENPRMLPLVSGEEQYVQRWMLKASLQYNPVTVTSQDFADTLDVSLINVDEAYPP